MFSVKFPKLIQKWLTHKFYIESSLRFIKRDTMKKMLVIVIVLGAILSGCGIIGISAMDLKSKSSMQSLSSSPDLSAYRYAVAQWSTSKPGIDSNFSTVHSNSLSTDYPLGSIIWQYQITGSYDTSPKAIAAIPDINNDGIDDVIVCSEDYYVRCFSGGALGAGVVLWEHEIYAGSVYTQNGLAITEDINGDGYNDIVVGATGGARLIQCISGKDGETIWTHDTHEYGDGGWVYQVDCRYDYNNDGIIDALAVTGDDSSDTGPKRVYCLDGLTGVSLWERPLGGPGFSVMGVEDFTGDGVPDVLAGCSNEAETIGYGKGINGATGAQMWSFQTPGSSVWAVEQLDDVTDDGIKDVIIGDFSGHIYGLNAAAGTQAFTQSIGNVIITRFETLGDVNSDGHLDIIPAHSTSTTTQVIDGYTGGIIWSHVVADQPWNVARIADITGDSIDDVLVGTLYNSNYVYFLNGVNGSELQVIMYGEAVDAIAAIPDVVGDGSMEMMAGGRDGKVTCFSGGKITQPEVNITADFVGSPVIGPAPLLVQFTDRSTAENTTITSWEWDFNDDGLIESTLKNPSWTYNETGNYTVSLTVSDGFISDTTTKANYIMVLPPGQSVVEIGNVTGEIFKITAEISNKGTTNVSSINWSITLDGNVVLLGRAKSGMIPLIPAGGMIVISDAPVFGFGRIFITITIEVPGGGSATKMVTGFLVLFLILGIH
jgi:PKD repeat protein